MFLELVIGIFLGIAFGIITGLIPGIHINLVSLLLVSVSAILLGFTSPLVLAVFIIAMSFSHTFLDPIPSIFFGAPDADMVLGVLPGHRLLLEGKGYEAVKLTVIGSLLSLITVIILIPFLLPLIPIVFSLIKDYVGYILLVVVIFMIYKEKGLRKKLWGLAVFLLAGVLGILVLGMPNLKQPLFGMLSGLFGTSMLVTSLLNNVKIPEQHITETITISGYKKVKAISAAVFSGSLTGLLPGLGSAQAAIISMQLVGNIGMYAFLVLVGGINTVNFVFSLATFYSIEKARNGSIVAVMQIIKQISFSELGILLGAVLVAGGIATFLAIFLTKFFSKIITKIKYRFLAGGVIFLIVSLVGIFSGFLGVLVLLVSTAIGIIPAIIGVKRSLAMGCLLLPVILFFLL